MSRSSEIKTIPEFLSEMPNVDVTGPWQRFWDILSRGKDRIAARFDVEKHASCLDREYYTSKDGAFEGSFNCYSGPGMEWLVHSWLGNRKNSLLDMNLTAFLGPENTVPHLRIIFGTFPRLYFSADYIPRKNLWTDDRYLDRYYTPINDEYLSFKDDSRFDWFVSRDPYIRLAESPTAISVSTADGDGVIDLFQETAERYIDRWLVWLDQAEPVAPEAQPAQQAFDHKVRELGYLRDPMNRHFIPAFGEAEINRMVDIRMGKTQMAESRRY